MISQPDHGKKKSPGRRRYPVFNRCHTCGSIIALSPVSRKKSAHTLRFFNPECSECSKVSTWARIEAEEGSRQLFRDPRDARDMVTRLQDQGVPAILQQCGESEYYVISYKPLQSEEEDTCPGEFQESCILPDGSRCEAYRNGICIRVQGEVER
jgi:hypothetical protein